MEKNKSIPEVEDWSPRFLNNTFIGKVVSGDQIGRSIGFPTLNIEIDRRRDIDVSPSIEIGVFLVRVSLDSKKYYGLLHAGPRPTLGKNEYRAEVFLLLNDEINVEVSSGNISFEVLKKIRDVQPFESLDELKEQIEKDVREGRKIIASLSD